jgi:hypothetical protein
MPSEHEPPRPDAHDTPHPIPSLPTDPSPSDPADGPGTRPFQLGAVLNGWTLRDILGEGGQGVVYRAEKKAQTAAIKTVRARRLTPDRLERLQGEYEIFAQLAGKPHTVALLDSFSATTDAGETVPVLVLQHIAGAMSITQAAAALGWDDTTKLAKVRDACDALIRMHDRGIRHFDIKPDNILVDPEGEVRVTDFGLSRAYSASVERPPGGSLEYMAPEQVGADTNTLDRRCDIYGVGAVLYELFAGQPPLNLSKYRAGIMSLETALHAIVSAKRTPIRQHCPSIDPRIEAIIERCIALRRGDRFTDMRALVEAIDRVLVPSVPWARLAVAAACAALAATLAFQLSVPLAERTGYARWLERTVTTRAAPVPPTATPLHTAVILFDDDTKARVDELAAARGLEGLSGDNFASIRALHGSICKALAKSSARVVVFDIKFRGPNRFEGPFVEGLEALRDAGIPVVFITPEWQDDPANQEPSLLSETLAPYGEWGVYHTNMIDDIVPRLGAPLAVRRGNDDLMPGLALTTIAAFESQGEQYSFDFESATDTLLVEYWEPIEGEEGGRRSTGRHLELPITQLYPHRPAPHLEEYGLRPGDLIYSYHPTPLDPEPLYDVTHPYHEVLDNENNGAELRTWFADRAVFIGTRHTNILGVKQDLHTDAHGRLWPGAHFHATAFESLARGIHPRSLATSDFRRNLAILGAILGALVGLALGPLARRLAPALPIVRGAARRGAAAAILVALVLLAAAVFPVLGALVLYSERLILVDALSPTIAFAAAAILTALALRILDGQRRTHANRGAHA